jgi:SMODS-associating 2TM, beta-strand rich effector domain
LNAAVFPDLNGHWDMRIEWNQGKKSGVKEATAIIRQDFLKISMEVHSDDSDSETHLAQPKKHPESGTPTLYYLYRVTPKQTAGEVYPPYNGSATLKLSFIDQGSLQGNYFTDAGSQGHFLLTKSAS